MTDWFDTHIHLLAPEWQQSPPALHSEAQSAGIVGMLMPGVRVDDWTALLTLAQQRPNTYFAPGLHPAYAEQWNDDAADQLRTLTRQPQVIAIGEIGLDGISGPPLEEQETVFRAQLAIALDAGLPVLLHCRKATGRMVAILEELRVGQRIGGIWHGFSGSVQIAQTLVDLGFKIGVGPVLLRESARKLPEAIRSIPDDALVLETDAPDMTRHPRDLIAVGRKLAELKNWTLDKTAALTSANARHLLHIDQQDETA